MKRLLLLNLWFGLVLSARGESTAGLPPALYQAALPGLVNVGETDRRISYRADRFHHYVGCGGVGCPDVLFVFLPGTGGFAGGYTSILRAVGATGIASIGLNYYNLQSAEELCSDDACFDQVRSERFFGRDGGRFVPTVADGVENRLLKVLQALKWTNFYDDSGLLTSKIIFGGHSQGAGMAAWIGKHFSVRRVCQIAGTWDHFGNQPASWLKGPSRTPNSLFYGFAHKNDKVLNGISYLSSYWEALGMGSNAPAPWDSPSGQKLVTSDPDCSKIKTGEGYHECSVVDGSTPVGPDGTPRYLNTWLYACGARNYELRCPVNTVPLYHFFHFANARNDGIYRQWHSFFQSNPPPISQDANSYTDGTPFVCLPTANYPGMALSRLFNLYSPFSDYVDQRVYTTSFATATALGSSYGLAVSAVYRTFSAAVPGSVALSSCVEAMRSQRILSVRNCADSAWAGFKFETSLGFAFLPKAVQVTPQHP